MSFLKSLRTNIGPLRNHINNCTLRGPKKKADRKGDGIVAEHILNIFKNRDDVAILPSEYYPPWVIGLKKPIIRPSDFLINSMIGEKTPEYQEFHTIFKNRRRNLKKLKNRNEWLHALYDQPKDDEASDDENLLDFENNELEKELNEIEGGGDASGGPGKEAPKAGGDKAAASKDDKK